MKIFVDTNAFLFMLRNAKDADKIANILDGDKNEIFTSIAVLNELKYKLLWLEATDRLHTNKKYAVLSYIKKNDNFREEVLIKYLEFYYNLVRKCHVYPLTGDNELQTIGIMMKYGLLPTDAYIIATMQSQNLQDILTDDSDFEKIANINVIKI